MTVTFIATGADFVQNAGTAFKSTGTENGAQQGTVTVINGQQAFPDSYLLEFSAIGETSDNELGQGSGISGITVYSNLADFIGGSPLYTYVPQNPGQVGQVQSDGSGTGDVYVSFQDVFVPAQGTNAPDLSGRLFVAPNSGVASIIGSRPEFTRVQNTDDAGDGQFNATAFQTATVDPDFAPDQSDQLVSLYDFDDASLQDEAGLEQPTGFLGDPAGNDVEIDNTDRAGQGELHLTNESDRTPGTFEETAGQAEHQLTQGRIEFVFNQDRQIGSTADTIFDRTNAPQGDGIGDLRIGVDNGAVFVQHGTGGGVSEYTISDAFELGDDVQVSYAWDSAGQTGGLVIENLSQGTLKTLPITDPLTLVQPNQSGSITLGTDEVNGYAFDGEVSYLAVYDANDAPLDPDESATAQFGETIKVDVVQYSTDADGDAVTVDPSTLGPAVDATGAIVGQVVIDPGSPESIIFAPNPGFAGDVSIPYTVTDGVGGTDMSVLTVTVQPPQAPTLDLDCDASIASTGAGSDLIALNFGSAQPTIQNDGKTVNADGIGETARYSNVAEVAGKSVDLLGVVVDAQKLDRSGDPNGVDTNPTLLNNNPGAAGGDGTANIRFHANSTVTMRWVVVESGTDIPVVGDFGVLVNDLDGNASLSRYERITVKTDELDSYTIGSDGTQKSNILVFEDDVDDTITFQPNDHDPGAPGARPDNSVGLTFRNTSEFVIEYEKLSSGGNVGLDGTFTSDFFSDAITQDTNPDFANRFTEDQGPVGIADPQTAKISTFGAGVSKLTIDPNEATFPNSSSETLILTGDGGSQITVLLSGQGQPPQALIVDGVDFTVSYDGDTLNVVPTAGPVDDAVMESVLKGVQYENLSELPVGVDGLTRVFDVTVMTPFGQTTDPAQASVIVVGVNDDPTAQDDFANTVEDSPVTIVPTQNDADPDSDDLTLSELGAPRDETGEITGTVTQNSDGTITFEPPPGFFGPITIQYQISDGQGGTDTANITINVQKDSDGDKIADVADLDDDNDGILDSVENSGPTNDTDGDGVINSLDLDSDNDGISDLIESGLGPNAFDPDSNGTIDRTLFVDADQDGLADAVEAINGDDTGTAPRNSDTDAIADYKDLDSDGDGISDFIEAQPTLDFETYDPQDSDQDGVIDYADSGAGFGGAFAAPVDTDQDGQSDYLDQNSDDDARDDSIESGLTLVGTLSNGIDDGALVTFVDQDGAVSIDGIAGLSDVFLNADPDLDELDFRTFPCFVAGTRIGTPDGSVNVEALQVGDQVSTMDHGPQIVRWVGHRTVEGQGAMTPVQISKGTLGTTQDMFVSPQHRMLVSGWQAEIVAGVQDALVPAKRLVNDETVRQVPMASVTYVHILFDQHQIIWANGAATESFHPAQIGIDALEDAARTELFALFPQLASGQGYGPVARRTLNAPEACLISV